MNLKRNPFNQTHRRFVYAAILVAICLLFFAQMTPTALAQTKSFRWLRFDVDITVLENGDLRIVETQTLQFVGSFSNGYAVIYTGETGRNDGISNVEVSEEGITYQQNNSNRPQTFQVSSSGDETSINWYFSPTTGQHTYTFSYTVHGAVRVEDNGDQLFWNAIPEDHPGLIDASRVVIHLPEGVTGGSTTALVGGEAFGATTLTLDEGRTVIFELTGTLGYGQAFETGVRFEHGLLTLAAPDWQQREQEQDTFNLLFIAASVFLAIAGPGIVLVRWYTGGRDPEVGPIADIIEAPPDDMPPGLVGTLVDENADMRDIMATMVDLARRGYLTMEETKSDFTFHRTDKSEDDLRDYEKQLFRGLFRSKEKQNLKDLKNRFYSKLPAIRKAMYQELISLGMTDKSPESVRSSYRGIGSMLILPPAIGAFCIFVVFEGAVPITLICPALALVLIGFTLVFLGGHMPRKTFKGAETTARWEAFRRYLENVQQYTDLAEAAEKFEEYLPYAIAFGIERRWLKEFEAVPQAVRPIWYLPYPRPASTFFGIPTGGSSGSSGGLEGASRGLTQGISGMSGSLTRMLNSSASTFKSTPSSSGSSGGSSGGFSGGFSGGSSGGGSRGFG